MGGAAERHARWLTGAAVRAPLPEAELREHMTPELLEACGGAAGLNAGFDGLGRLTIDRTIAARPDLLQAAVSSGAGRYLLTVHVNRAGLIDGLLLTPDPPPPSTWADLDDPIAALGTRVSFVAGEIGATGELDVAHGVDADVMRPVASAFKLYVLGALAQAVRDGRASWDEPLAVRDAWKSVPSGRLQDRPAGDELPLAEYADLMIAISDNTATDHLIHHLGRDAVHRQLEIFGHQRPAATIPILTTRALTCLREVRYPELAEEYLTGPWEQAIAELERLPLPEEADDWTRPRMIDRIEWFASPTDIGRALAGLHALGGPEIDRAMSLDDGGLNLDVSRFPGVWFKGGIEPGVVTLNHLARTPDGRALVVSVMVSDPDEVSAALAWAMEDLPGCVGAVRQLHNTPERSSTSRPFRSCRHRISTNVSGQYT